MPARWLATLATTSFTFMLVEVPEPVWNTSIGKCRMSGCGMPNGAGWANSARSSSHAAVTAAALSFASSPSSAFASAQHFLRRMCASICAWGTGRNDTGKLSTARCVVAP